MFSLGGLAGPVKAAGSSVRVFVWVIRSPETLRVRFAFAFPILVRTGTGLSLRCVAVFRFRFCKLI